MRQILIDLLNKRGIPTVPFLVLIDRMYDFSETLYQMPPINTTVNMPEGIKYAKDFQIPADFPEVLRNLTREILRDQPKDINKYALDYFEKLKQEKTLANVTSDDNY